MKIKKRQIISKIKTISLAVVAIAIFTGLIFFLKSDFWSIKKITCRYNETSCSSEVEKELGRLASGKNILFISRKEFKKEVLKKELMFKDVKIFVRLPDEVIFEFKKREPEAAVVVQSGIENKQASESAKPEFLTTEDFFIVDRDGVILAKEKKSDLPLVLVTTTIEAKIGERINQDELLKAVELLADLRLNLLEPKLVRLLSGRSMEVWFKDNITSVFSGKKNLKNQLDSLQLIFSRAKIEGRKIKRVDLRFDKPVVTYE